MDNELPAAFKLVSAYALSGVAPVDGRAAGPAEARSTAGRPGERSCLSLFCCTFHRAPLYYRDPFHSAPLYFMEISRKCTRILSDARAVASASVCARILRAFREIAPVFYAMRAR